MVQVQTRNLLRYTLGVHICFLGSLVLLCFIMLFYFYTDYNAFFRIAARGYVWDPASITAFSLAIYTVLISVACIVCHTKVPILSITLRIMSSLAIFVLHILLLTQVSTGNTIGLLCITFWWYVFQLTPYVILCVLAYFVLIRCNTTLSPSELCARGISVDQLVFSKPKFCLFKRRSGNKDSGRDSTTQQASHGIPPQSGLEGEDDGSGISEATAATTQEIPGAQSTDQKERNPLLAKAAETRGTDAETPELAQQAGGSDRGRPSLSEDGTDSVLPQSRTLSAKKQDLPGSLWRGMLDDLEIDFDTGQNLLGPEFRPPAEQKPHSLVVLPHCNLYVQISLFLLIVLLDIVFYAGFGHPGYYGNEMAVRTIEWSPALVAERVAPSIMPDMSKISVDRLFTIMDLQALELDVFLTADCEIVCAKSLEVSSLNGIDSDNRVLSNVTLAEASAIETGGLWAREDPYDTLAMGLYSRNLVEACKRTHVMPLRELLKEIIITHVQQRAPLALLLNVRNDEPAVQKAHRQFFLQASNDAESESQTFPSQYLSTQDNTQADMVGHSSPEDEGVFCRPGDQTTINGHTALTAICTLLKEMPIPADVDVQILCHTGDCVAEAWGMKDECGFSKVVGASSIIPDNLRSDDSTCYFEGIGNLRLLSQSSKCTIIQGAAGLPFIRLLWQTGARAIQTVTPHLLAGQKPATITIVGGGVFLFLMSLHVAFSVFMILWDHYMNPRIIRKRLEEAEKRSRPRGLFSGMGS